MEQLTIRHATQVEEYFRNDNEQRDISLETHTFDLSVESINIASNMLNNISKWNLSECKKLKAINCGDNCGIYMMDFVLKEMPFLETITIGSKSFTLCPNNFKNSNRKFHVSRCPKLTKIYMGGKSFTDCQDFILCGKWIYKYLI